MSSSAEMTLREHLDELRSRVMHIALAIIIVTIFSMSFGLKHFEYSGLDLIYPYPNYINNTSVELTHFMKDTLLPPNVKLIQTAPGQAFFAQLYVSMLIGLIVAIPVIVREISAFISPAISKKTRVGVLNVFLPAVALFVAGMVFSYILVIPYIIDFLYRYGEAIDVETFLTINDFITFVMQFLLGFGISFQLPVIMYGISLTGTISPKFWRSNFRYAVIAIVIFGAVITPDGSGVTMWFVAAPMIILYLGGLLVVERRARRKEATPATVV